MGQPTELYQGDWTEWVEDGVPESATAVTAWLRGTSAGSGVQASGLLTEAGWRIILSTQVTGAMEVGTWALQVVATVNGQPQTVRRGSLQVRRTLAFSGTAGAFDDRSQIELDLAAVEKAIRVLVGGAQDYQIADRRFRRADLAELIKWRDQLKAEVLQQRRADALNSGSAVSRKIRVAFQ